jgi:hypothetical protein
MNAIVSKQAEARAIRQLRAQRYLYSKAKNIVALQTVLAIGVPLLAVVAGIMQPSLRPIAALTALLVAILDVGVLDPWQKTFKKRAATIKEEFDCEVLDLPWNEFRVGRHPDPEDEHAASKAYLRGAVDPSLENWYPVIVSEVPLPLGRLICQRSSVRWDSALRRGYVRWLTMGVAVGFATALYVGLLGHLKMEEFVLRVVAPLTPFSLWAIREVYRQREAAESLERLKDQIEGLWSRALEGKCAPADCAMESRLFQDETFERRKTSPVIFDWIYSSRRQKMEDEMTVAAAELVRQAKERVSAESRKG